MKPVSAEKGERTAPPQDFSGETITAGDSDDEAGAPPPRRTGLRRWRRVLLIAGPLLVLLAGAVLYLGGGRYVATENAYVKADKVMVAAEVSGLITEVPVRENQRVARGDVLFRIDDAPYRLALAEAEARLAGARGEIESLKATYRQQQEELALARTNLAFAERAFERQQKLVASRAISQSSFDAAQHDLDVARQQIGVTEQEIAQTRAKLAGDPDIPVERHPTFLAAKAAQDRAALDLERTVVRAPFDGIASATPQTGKQVIGNGPLSSPVMNIVADKDVWIEANFKETDLTHVRPGQPVSVHVDTYPDREWEGRVDSISQATGAEFSIIPPQNATGNWVKVVQRIPVRISVDPGDGEAALRAGMSTGVTIDTGERRRLPGFLSGLWPFSADATAASAESAATGEAAAARP